MQNLGCDPLRALAPITLAAVQPFVVAASNNVPAKSIAELVALAKAKPNSLSYGSGGVRAASHLGVVLLEQKGGFELLHVAYKGSNPAITAVMAHEIQLTLAGLSNRAAACQGRQAAGALAFGTIVLACGASR